MRLCCLKFVPEPEEGFQSAGNLSEPAEGCLQDTVYLKGRFRSIDVLCPPRPSTPSNPLTNCKAGGHKYTGMFLSNPLIKCLYLSRPFVK